MASDRSAPPPSQDRLDVIRAHVAQVRDLELSNADMEARVKENKAVLNKLQHEVLPDLFSAAQMREYVLDAEGNLPPYRARLAPYYKAGIAADWSEEEREAGFAALREAGGEDLIRTNIVIDLNPGDIKLAERIEAGLRRMGVPFTRELAVHWRTLTAFVQEQYEKKPPQVLPLDKLGAVVGRKVTIKKQEK